jgi:hypothetical protein
MAKFTPSFAAALKVAELLEAFLPESIMLSKCFPNVEFAKDELTKDYYNIQAYQNGREQGVTINLAGLTVGGSFFVCMYRTSDLIGYWKGSYSMQGIDEEAWKAGFNGFNTLAECAEAIAKEIKKILAI